MTGRDDDHRFRGPRWTSALGTVTMNAMSGANPLPRDGEVFFDDRGKDRALRLSWHSDAQVMVISIWNGGVCSGTFRLSARDVPAFMESLSQAMPSSPPRGRRHAAPDGRAEAPAGGRHAPPGPDDDGPGPTTQALDALKSLSSPAPAPPPQPPRPQPPAHHQPPQPPPVRHRAAPPPRDQQPYRQPPAARHHPQAPADRRPARPPQQPPVPHQPDGGNRFPVTGEYERRPNGYPEYPRRPR